MPAVHIRLILACVAAVTAGILTSVSPASAAPYAPVSRPGPALRPSASELAASLQCTPNVDNATVEPVLLSPGTSATQDESFAWNWQPAFNQLGIPWCGYKAPMSTLGPIDLSGEYLAYAIRTMYAKAHRKIAVMGWSQGGMSMRWALRFWPDTRAMVSDVIGMEPSNHGTTQVNSGTCASAGCSPAVWQQLSSAEFIKAINSTQETFGGIAYTNIYSHTDGVVAPDNGSTPADCSSCLFTGDGQISNVALQSICPLNTSNHVTAASIDLVNYHLVVDALTHDGPADPSRVPASACNPLGIMPGVTDPAAAPGAIAALQGALALTGLLPGPVPNPVAGNAVVYSEPALPCYVFTGTCAATTPLTLSGTQKRVGRQHRKRLVVHVSAVIDSVAQPVPGAAVRLGHRKPVMTDDSGNAYFRTARSHRCRSVSATAADFAPGKSFLRANRMRLNTRCR